MLSTGLPRRTPRPTYRPSTAFSLRSKKLDFQALNPSSNDIPAKNCLNKFEHVSNNYTNPKAQTSLEST
ncbi:hypothetical protein Hanom_Chr12g01178751 [Helianthus anomalus]